MNVEIGVGCQVTIKLSPGKAFRKTFTMQLLISTQQHTHQRRILVYHWMKMPTL